MKRKRPDRFLIGVRYEKCVWGTESLGIHPRNLAEAERDALAYFGGGPHILIYELVEVKPTRKAKR